jgi:pimeloyl-ACP methyl ester carboxylesterase
MDFPFGQLRHLDSLIFRDLESREKYPFFLLAVQCPRDREGKWIQWFEMYGEGNADPNAIEPAAGAVRILDVICAEYPVDSARIYLCGVSSGGTATWELALRYPDRFAAVVPLASDGTTSNLTPIKSVPVWAFHSEGDKPEGDRQTISNLKGLGGICHLTEVPGKEHSCWYAAFQDYGLLDWMLLQKCDSRPDTITATWQFFRYDYFRWTYIWPRTIPVAAVVVAIWLGRVQLRRNTTRKVMDEEMSFEIVTIESQVK